MRVGVVLLVGAGLLVITGATGACSGPGANDDACTSAGGTCIDLSLPNHPACESYPYPCTGSGPTFSCCGPANLGGGGSTGTAGSSGTGGSGGTSGSK